MYYPLPTLIKPATQYHHSIAGYIRSKSGINKTGLGWSGCFLFACCTASQAQTVEQQFQRLLSKGANGDYCVELVGNSARDPLTLQPVNFGPQLAGLCVGLPTGGGGSPPPPVGSGPGGATSGSAAGAGQSVLGQADQLATRRRQQSTKDKKSGGGSGDDGELALSPTINLFFNADYRELDRRQTVFEQGYFSNQKGFSLGADTLLTDWLVAGLAFNYSHWHGDQISGGGFQTDSFGPTVFASLTPWQGFFADMSFQYANKTGSNTGQRQYAREDNTNFGGTTTGSPGAAQYEGNFLTGYDVAIGGLTIGPRAAIRYRRAKIDGYTEQGNSGLELRFLPDSLTSVQSSVGAQASFVLNTQWAVLIPQLNADWTHEYADGQREILVEFAQDNRINPTLFTIQTDRPDRDFFRMGAGVVAVLPHGWQAFVNFETIIGHAYFDNYTGTVGFRLGL